MVDFGLLVVIMSWALVAVILIAQVFKWGYNKEKRGERTDIFGNDNNHMSDNDMD